MPAHESLEVAVAKLGIGDYSRHVFLCAGPTCCETSLGQAAWDKLKAKLSASGLGNRCHRARTVCLRVCVSGPILVVYPEGTWYAQMTADRIPRLVREHLIGGNPIDEWIFARNPLGPAMTNVEIPMTKE